MRTEKAQKSMYNILTEILGKAITLIISVIIPKLYIESYGSEFNGLLTSIAGIFIYLNLLEAGIGSASIQALYKCIIAKDKEKIGEILSATKNNYRRNGVYFLACVSVLAFLYPYYAHTLIDYATVVILVFISAVPYLIKFFFQGKYTVLLTADNRSYILNIVNYAFNVIANVVKIILLLAKCDVVLVQAVFSLVYVFQTFFIYLYVKKNYTDISFNSKPNYDLISQSHSAMVHEVAYVVFSNIDVVLLTYFCGLKVVSVYSIYNLVYVQLALLLQSFTNGTNASLGQLMAEDKEKYRDVYLKFEHLFQCLSCLVIVSAGAMTRPFVLLYTANATDIDYIMPGITGLFVIIQLFSLARWPGISAIKAGGFFEATKKSALIETAINLLLSIVLVVKFKMYGVLIATAVALLYRMIDVNVFVRKRILERGCIKDFIQLFVLLAFSVTVFVIEYQYNIKCSSFVDFVSKGFLLVIINFIPFSFYYYVSRKILQNTHGRRGCTENIDANDV